MELKEAIDLIRPAVPAGSGTWADLGAGTGLFSRALAALLGDGSRVLALDRDARALSALRLAGRDASAGAEIVPIRGDFQELDSIPELRASALAGALFANALHFAADPARVLARAARLVGDGGRIVVVEYHGRPANPWVPFPVPMDRLAELAAPAGLRSPRIVGQRPSAYGGVMYCAVLERADGPGS